MTKRSLLTSKYSRRLYLFSGIFLVILLLFLGHAVNLLSTIQRPFLVMGTRIYEEVFFFLTAGNISPEELETLITQRDQYMIDQTELIKLRDENESLLKLLGFVARTNYSVVSANITGRSINPDSNRFFIDRGREDGIREGQAVIVDDGIIIGKILSANPYTSTVAVLSDSDTALAVSVLNKTRTIGLLTGGTGNLLRMSLIPDEERIQINDIVVTSGLEEQIPSGLLVGAVNAVITNEQTPFQEAVIEPIIDPRRQYQVLVLTTDLL
jgi:rod shape-determining protein MreC